MSDSMQKCPECQYPRLLLTTAIVRELIRVSELYSASCAMHLFIMLQSLLLFRVNQSNRDVLPIGGPVPFRERHECHTQVATLASTRRVGRIDTCTQRVCHHEYSLSICATRE